MITDKRLRELIELAEIAIVQYGEEHETMAGVKGSVRLSEDYQIYQELLTLREQAEVYKGAKQFIDELQEQNKALIEDAERLAELLSIDIPPATEYEKKVARDVGDKYGYGAIMSALSNVWHIEKEHGENGAITIGHCYGTIKKVLQQHNDLMQEIGCSPK